MSTINKEFLQEIQKRKYTTIPNNPHRHWADFLAEKVIETFPNEDMYTCAAGITPSGIVHFGNFRDIMTNYAVVRALEERGKKARLLFSWDNYDRFRKVPAGVPDSYEQYIGLPVTQVPDPSGKYDSYARSFESELEDALSILEIPIEFRYQTQMYTSGKYVDGIRIAFQKRQEIAALLLSFMSEKSKKDRGLDVQKYIAEYYPGSVYSSFTGKDTTQILDYDGDTNITYRCLDTGKEEQIDFSISHQIGLRWKTDWPMRWQYENVHFEPGGLDHGTPGGSYDTSTMIAKQIYDRASPVFATYQFIGIRGLQGKMSGSKGNAISPSTLLDIYTPEILKWLYLRKLPGQPFDLAFDSEMIRQYGEFDREILRYHTDKLGESAKKSLAWSYPDGAVPSNELEDAPFRQISSLGQIIQWDADKMRKVFEDMDKHYDPSSIDVRLQKAQAWMETYNREEMITLIEDKNTDMIASLDASQIDHIRLLHTYLSDQPDATIRDLDICVYSIPKDESADEQTNKQRQREFFMLVYNLLIAEETGPRLSTFLWALDREKVLQLLDV